MKYFNLSQFISNSITKRPQSLFEHDLQAHKALLAKRINEKSVLVIGGAGTIGSSFIKALLRFQPKRLYVVDINENGLTELTRDLRSAEHLKVPDDYKSYPINFGDPVFEKIIRKEGPFEIVANFAAHKHVRSEKDEYSIEAMIDNNVIKAKKLLDLLLEFPPNHFFCVSTDKAANPVNVMGASKKLMEEVILTYASKIPISTARFANVAFSNGSLPFGFMERIMKRQPLSAPLDVKRYFVSPEESGQICLLACILGESGDIFFPKLEESQMMAFSDIADLFLAEQGFTPVRCESESAAKLKAGLLSSDSRNYPVYYFKTDTSGEKSFEEFYTQEETVDWDKFKKLGVIKGSAQKTETEIVEMFDKLKILFKTSDLSKAKVVELLSAFIPNFKHIETGKGLDQKM
jgi:FlaA1/EpsC-like NDP-sugar epimerase